MSGIRGLGVRTGKSVTKNAYTESPGGKAVKLTPVKTRNRVRNTRFTTMLEARLRTAFFSCFRGENPVQNAFFDRY